MGDLRLTAIGIGELRTLFAGRPDVEAHLRAVAARAFPPPEPPARGGLLGKIGPLTRVPVDAPVVAPGVPTGQDVHDVATGRFVRPERLTAAWALVRLWLDACGWPTLSIGIDEPAIDDLDFELATGGVETRYGLRRLLNGRLGVPLRDAPGQVTGYLPFAEARALREAWRPAIPTLSPANAATAGHLVGWLGGLEGWAVYARAARHPLPDLVASFTA